MKRAINIFLIIFILPPFLMASDEGLLHFNEEKPRNLFKKPSQIDPLMRAEKPELVLASDKNKAYNSYINAGFKHRSFLLNHYERVFITQYWFSFLIFFVVLILVGVGVYLSYIQFKKSLNSDEAEKDKETELSISKEGIKIRSSIIGLIILAISFAFFYSYLRYVYPINIVTSQSSFSDQKKK